MSFPNSPAPTTRFPPLPDELDDAVYSADGPIPIPISTPALTSSTSGRAIRTSRTPPSSQSGPIIPPRSSSLPLVRANPRNPALKYRISAPMPLGSFEASTASTHMSYRSTPTVSSSTSSTLSSFPSGSSLSTSTSISSLTPSLSSLTHSACSSPSHSPVTSRSGQYHPISYHAQAPPEHVDRIGHVDRVDCVGADCDPFTDFGHSFTNVTNLRNLRNPANVTKSNIMSRHFELPDLPPAPEVWRRASSSASLGLPSIKEGEERRIERVWW
ncbi:hypothetical protein CspeluHIS016_0100490 [Cutaneotrichosporon spelunceum]|uniref:Uncharacterized protein n=1 Tax=Cutaneotrichosporon spelunceum TaxID=1672016 RepID=A0AAD3TMA3_9TREE|nr:hypothetical protein CspeluHIS016_0100490 [Cutaneotrichosporon spelunceum]